MQATETTHIVDEDVCEICGGTGEISTMESVYTGEPHMASVGTRPCECQSKDEDTHSSDE